MEQIIFFILIAPLICDGRYDDFLGLIQQLIVPLYKADG